MDGDRAPLAELAALAQRHDAWLMADDAHDLDFAAAARADVPLRIGTLSKALGAYGGYVCASQPVIDLIRNRARTLIYSTGLPPAIAGRRHRRARPDRARARPAGAAARQGARLHPRRRSAGGAKRDRAGGDRRGAGRARRIAAAGGRRLSGGRDPPADRAGGHRAAAADASARCIPTPRSTRLADVVRTRILAQRMSAIFITATGTDIGKTFVAAGLIRHWRAAGRTVDALKPVVTGFDPAEAEGSDAGVLLTALGQAGHAGGDRAHLALALCRAAVARHGGAAREPHARFRRAGRVLAARHRGQRRHAADRRRRRHHGAARRPPHRARLDGGAERAAACW